MFCIAGAAIPSVVAELWTCTFYVVRWPSSLAFADRAVGVDVDGKYNVAPLDQLPHGDKTICKCGHSKYWQVHACETQTNFEISCFCCFCLFAGGRLDVGDVGLDIPKWFRRGSVGAAATTTY